MGRWEWWLKKVGTNDWSPLGDWEGRTFTIGDGVIVPGKCPGKDGGTYEHMENSTGQRLSKLYPSKGLIKLMMEGT